MPDPATEFRRLLHDVAAQREVYDFTRKVLKLRSNQCAATVSEFLRRAGYLTHVRTWTADLDAALTAAKWTRHTGVPPDYAVVFSADHNGNGAPDHVYVMLGMVDPATGVAMILDNYVASPHLRNLNGAVTYKGVRYSRTRMAYYMVPPEKKPRVAMPPAVAAECKAAFVTLFEYEDFLQTLDDQRQLHEAREAYRRAGVT